MESADFRSAFRMRSGLTLILLEPQRLLPLSATNRNFTAGLEVHVVVVWRL